MAWYEDLDRYLAHGPVSFAYALSVRRGNYSPWRYRLHLATQVAAVRSLRRACNSAQRWHLARRRGKAALTAVGISRPTRS
jgi:hypothetical protein